MSLLPSSQISLSDPPFLGAQGGDQSPLLPIGVGSCLGTGPGALPYPVAIPGELVCSSNESIEGLAIRRVRTVDGKGTQDTVRSGASSFISGLLQSNMAEPPVLWLQGPASLEFFWGLQKCCRNQYSGNQAPHSESWRTQVYYTGGHSGVNISSCESQANGLQTFYRQAVVGNTSCS